MKLSSVWILAVASVFPGPKLAQAQESPLSSEPAKLADLLAEAERNNPQIQAARHGWDSARKIPTQVSALPDPEIMVQQFSVGSPRPFAGYTNSDFAYIGRGFSQELPFPGKLRLKGEIAKKDSEVAQQRYESIRRKILVQVKAEYFRLGYLAKGAPFSKAIPSCFSRWSSPQRRATAAAWEISKN